MGRAAHISTVMRGTRHVGAAEKAPSFNPGSLRLSAPLGSWSGRRGAVAVSLPASAPYSVFGGRPKRFFIESVTPAVTWFLSLARETDRKSTRLNSSHLG